MIRVVAVAGLALAAAAAGGACARPGAAGDDGVRVEMRVTPEPPAVGVAAVELRLADAAGRPLDALAVALEGNMSHAGMAPTFAAARLRAPGVWAADLELTMAGDWTVTVEARLAGGRTVTRTLPLAGVRAAGETG